jgi:hypothetical protein
MTGGEGGRAPGEGPDWSARYRFDAQSAWRDCWIVDISFEGAEVELDDISPAERLVGNLELEISSIASDQVGIVLRTVIQRADRPSPGRAMVGLDFAHWGREESLLLHLLVGLRNYV